jgi:hypothetical protein
MRSMVEGFCSARSARKHPLHQLRWSPSPTKVGEDSSSSSPRFLGEGDRREAGVEGFCSAVDLALQNPSTMPFRHGPPPLQRQGRTR